MFLLFLLMSETVNRKGQVPVWIPVLYSWADWAEAEYRLRNCRFNSMFS